MACLALQETDQLMFETMAVLLSNKQNKNQNKASYFKFFFSFWLFDVFSFSFSIIITKISLQFQGKFCIVWWNLWFIKVEMEAGSPHWGMLFGFVILG